MTIGTEHEYSINDSKFNPLPISDRILQKIGGEIVSELELNDFKMSKELQKTVIEFIPSKPSDDLISLERPLYNGVRRFYHEFKNKYWLLGLGMHPTLTLNQTAVWDHDEGEYYKVYDRLFNIKQHGWLNIQALQINLSYANEAELITNYNKIRALLPYLIAVTAASPIVEGKLTKSADNRLLYYRENQKEIPAICNRIIPEKINSVSEYNAHKNKVFAELHARDADVLCEEWVNSSGVIIRFSRHCLEIKAIDEQESIHSDMAVCAFVRSLIRNQELVLPEDHETLTFITERAIKNGTDDLKDELMELYKYAWSSATQEEKRYLPIIGERIVKGSLAELMRERCEEGESVQKIMHDMAVCLRINSSYGTK
jgi:gamma-glutamyl:cysteine ligase YbdK (ATP-grasp superfamily)